MTASSAGPAFRTALAEEAPLQCVGVLNAYTARQAHACGYRALYLSGGGVAAGSLGYPDLGITGLEDVHIYMCAASSMRAGCRLPSKPGIGIAKPTGLNIIGNCALFKNPKHDQLENFTSVHTFSSGSI